MSPLVLLLLLLLPFSAFVSGQESISPPIQISGEEEEEQSSGGAGAAVVSLLVKSQRREGERILSDEEVVNTTLLLAANRTHRKDPLHHFNKYNRGWNISNRHYWASVAYTAAPFFIVAAIWFALVGLSLIITCLYFCCCRKDPYGYSRFAYALSLILLTLFTIAAIIGCVILYIGQGKYHSTTINTLEYVVLQAYHVREP